MSTRILIIPEDFRKDQYILKPIIQALFTALGKPNARVEVCTRPLLTGIAQTMDKKRLSEIFEEYQGMVDLFLLCVDRDCDTGRRDALSEREDWAQTDYQHILIAEHAWQELEVWILAGHDLPADWHWETVRAECNPKEIYFVPFAEQREVVNTPGGGRKILAEQAARHYTRIKQLCPEDIGVLEIRVRQWLKAS